MVLLSGVESPASQLPMSRERGLSPASGATSATALQSPSTSGCPRRGDQHLTGGPAQKLSHKDAADRYPECCRMPLRPECGLEDVRPSPRRRWSETVTVPGERAVPSTPPRERASPKHPVIRGEDDTDGRGFRTAAQAAQKGCNAEKSNEGHSQENREERRGGPREGRRRADSGSHR